jgi:hypothetical protein
MLATFSVPERKPFSCPPPRITGSIEIPFLMYNAPMPFGPFILWEEIDSKSIPNSLTSIRILPVA